MALIVTPKKRTIPPPVGAGAGKKGEQESQRRCPFPYAGIIQIRSLGFNLSPGFLSGTPLTVTREYTKVCARTQDQEKPEHGQNQQWETNLGLDRAQRMQMPFHRQCQSIQIISPFKDRHNRGDSFHKIGQSCETVLRERHICQGIVSVRVKPGRNEQQTGSKAFQGRDNFPFENRDIDILAGSGMQGKIQRIALAAPDTPLPAGACSRIKGVLVQAHVQDRRVILERMLRAVSMVYIPIENSNALNPMLLLGMTRTDRNIVEEAKPHGPVTLRVMPWRTDSTEGRVCLSGEHSINRCYNSTSREQRSFIGTR
jgi:hypothetical protein